MAVYCALTLVDCVLVIVRATLSDYRSTGDITMGESLAAVSGVVCVSSVAPVTIPRGGRLRNPYPNTDPNPNANPNADPHPNPNTDPNSNADPNAKTNP